MSWAANLHFLKQSNAFKHRLEPPITPTSAHAADKMLSPPRSCLSDARWRALAGYNL